jgi:coenzyme F420-reducing hydrogenase delta subunit
VCFGTFGFMSNKGAIGISFKVGSYSVLCVGCHLTCKSIADSAGESKVAKRNENVQKLMNKLQIPRVKGQKVENRPKFEQRADLVAIMGDLNYRIVTDLTTIRNLVETSNFPVETR